MATNMKYDIFISYSRLDRDVVDPFVEQLESRGYNVWFDKTGVYSGSRFKSVLVQAIEESEVFLFFSSKGANASSWTAKEIAIAVNRQKTIIPIKLDNTRYNKEVEFDLINLDFVDFYNISNINQERVRLMRTLEDLFDKKQTDKTQRNFSNQGNNTQSAYNYKNQKEIELLTFIKKNRGCTITIAIMALLLIVVLPEFMPSRTSAPPKRYETRETRISEEDFNEDESAANPNDFTRVTAADPQLVDLGLPSGTLWLDRNLGASSPEEPGMYFAWGEVKEKDEYNAETYFNKERFDGLDGERYFTRIIMKEISGTQFDAATNILGDGYRMPTKDDMKELIRYCSWQYGSFHGKPVYKVIGPNDDCIFLPACGEKVNLSLHKSYDCYWTSTVTDESPWALELKGYEYSNNSSVEMCDLTNSTLVEWGHPIRPVSKL